MGCSKCKKSKCGCNAPYYQQADVCLEDHCQKVFQPQFSFSVCPTSSWNVPLCGQTAILDVPGLQGATVGSFIWHPQFGYYEIISIDTVRNSIGIVNNCNEGNASAGAQVPACTCFVITVPPADTNPLSDVCVAIDFTAPEEGDPTDIMLTSTTGIVAGDTVQIGTGFYFVQEVKADNIITIVNQGEGIIPGTPVIALNFAGEFQYCLTAISVNPCSRVAEDQGTVLVCNDTSLGAPLNTIANGNVLTAVDNDNNEAAFRPLDSTVPICTQLSAELQINIGDPTYTLTVESTSGFTVGDILILDNRTDRAEITAITDAVTMDVTLDPVPGVNQLLPVGTFVCQIGCCERIDDRVDCLATGTRLTIPAALYNQTITIGAFPQKDFEVVLDSNVIEFTAPNDCPGSTYHVRAEVNLAALIDSSYFDFAANAAIISSELQMDWDNNPGVAGRLNWTLTGNDGVDITGFYPTTTENAIWGILQILQNSYSIAYHGGYIIADTIVASGNTITLRLNYKAIVGDNFLPNTVDAVAVYMIGNLVITKVI